MYAHLIVFSFRQFGATKFHVGDVLDISLSCLLFCEVVRGVVHGLAVLAHVSAAGGALLVLGHPVLHVEQMTTVGTSLAPGVESFHHLEKIIFYFVIFLHFA